MGQIISATTRFSGAVRRRERFLHHARLLLDDAHANMRAGDPDLALESAYQAALRTAGAWIATSEKLAKRKRLPSSAWERLALIGGTAAEWSENLSAYSALRSRVASGIEYDPDPAVVGKVISLAEQFLAETEGTDQQGAAA